MTPTDVKNRVENIRACLGDDEVCHTLEDALHIEVLAAIAAGAPNAAQLAAEALETCELAFERWCA